MIRYFLLSFCTLCVFESGAQNFQWAKQYTDDFYKNMTVTQQGEVYVTGNKILAAKLNADGTADWQKKFPSSFLNGQDIKMDNDSNLFVAGKFNGTNQIDGTTLKATIGEGFIAKLDKKGNINWIRQTTSQNAAINKLELDADGNAIVSGNFSGTDLSFGNNLVYNSGKNDGFMAKIRTNGAVEWIYTVSTTGDDGLYDFNILPDGNMLLTGYYNGEGGIGVDYVPESQTKTGFYAIFNPENGKVVSIQTDTLVFYQKIVQKSNSYYFTASFTGRVTIAGDTFTNSSLVEKDGLIIQTDDLLQPTWATQIKGGVPSTIGLNKDGSIIAGGGFDKKISFTQQSVFSGKGEADMFFVAYDNSHTLLWAMHPSGPNIDEVYRVYSDTINDNFYILASVQSGPVKFGDINVSGNFSGAPFIAKSGTIISGTQKLSNTFPSLKIFPNPAAAMINVQLPLKSYESCKLNIISISGQNIYQNQIKAETTQIDLQNIKTGMYILQIITPEKLYNQLISVSGN